MGNITSLSAFTTKLKSLMKTTFLHKRASSPDFASAKVPVTYEDNGNKTYYDSTVTGADLQKLYGASSDLPANQTITGAISTLIHIIGQRGWNQMIHGEFGSNYSSYWSVYSGTGSVSNGELTVKNATGRNGMRLQNELSLDASHKYFAHVEYKSDKVWYSYAFRQNFPSSNSWTEFETITIYNAGIGINERLLDTFPAVSGEVSTASFRNFMFIDLTAIFGSGNEPTTVAQFKAIFPKDYYPYHVE